jgi:hypothetical protein
MCISSALSLVDVHFSNCTGCLNNSISYQFSGDKDGDSKSCKEFANGMGYECSAGFL